MWLVKSDYRPIMRSSVTSLDDRNGSEAVTWLSVCSESKNGAEPFSHRLLARKTSSGRPERDHMRLKSSANKTSIAKSTPCRTASHGTTIGHARDIYTC